jgi:hypothetical protein
LKNIYVDVLSVINENILYWDDGKILKWTFCEFHTGHGTSVYELGLISSINLLHSDIVIYIVAM